MQSSQRMRAGRSSSPSPAASTSPAQSLTQTRSLSMSALATTSKRFVAAETELNRRESDSPLQHTQSTQDARKMYEGRVQFVSKSLEQLQETITRKEDNMRVVRDISMVVRVVWQNRWLRVC